MTDKESLEPLEWWETSPSTPESFWGKRMAMPMPQTAEAMLVEIINAAIDDDEPNAAPTLYSSVARARVFLQAGERLAEPEQDAIDAAAQQVTQPVAAESHGCHCGDGATLPVQLTDADSLAQIIRIVDGSNTLGAGALAEAILAASPVQPANEGQLLSPQDQIKLDRHGITGLVGEKNATIKAHQAYVATLEEQLKAHSDPELSEKLTEADNAMLEQASQYAKEADGRFVNELAEGKWKRWDGKSTALTYKYFGALWVESEPALTEHTLDELDLARKILTFMGYAISPSREPNADPLADRLAFKLMHWLSKPAALTVALEREEFEKWFLDWYCEYSDQYKDEIYADCYEAWQARAMLAEGGQKINLDADTQWHVGKGE